MATRIPRKLDPRSASFREAWPGPIAGIALLAASFLIAAAAPLAAQPVIVINEITHTPSSVVAGSSTDVVYDFDIRNTATGTGDDETNVILRLPLVGSGLTYQSETFPPGTENCTVLTSPDRLDCNLGNMQENTARTGTITFRVQADEPAGTLSSIWEVFGDVDTTADSEQEDVTVTVEAEIVVDKTGPAEAVPGNNVAYSATVTNNGPSDATNVALSDAGLPALFGSPTYGGDCDLPASCGLGTIAAGASKSATITYTIPDNYHLTVGALTTVTDTATATTDTPDTDPASSDYSDSVDTPVVPKADLSVTLTNSVSSVSAGMPVSYSVTVNKTGPSRVSGVLLTLSNSAISNILSPVVTPAEGIFTASPISPNWFALDLAGTDSASLSLSGWLNPGVTGTSFAPQITVAPQPGVTDTGAGNNSSTDTDTISRPADLRIVKTNGLTGLVPGQLAPYTITVVNEGPADVAGATVADNLDATRISSASWSYSLARELTAIGQLTDGDGGVDGLDGAAAVVASENGKHVYVAGAGDNAVARFDRSAVDGSLTFVSRIADDVSLGISGASALALSPTGGQLYVAGTGESALQVFTRNSTTGALAALEVHRNGVAGVSGMSGPRGVAVAPDGRHVYVAAETTGAIVTFSRNLSTGALTFVSSIPNGGGVSGLGGARAVAVAPDGNAVIVAGFSGDAVAYFSRNPSTNALTFISAFVDGTATGEGLDGASALAFSPRGDAFYAVGSLDNAVVAFGRTLSSNVVTYREREVHGVAGVTNLLGPNGVSVSPDGATVFVAATGSGAIVAFDRIQTPGVDQHKLDFLAATIVPSASGLGATAAGEQLYAVAGALDQLAMFSETRGSVAAVPAGSDLTFSEVVTLPARAAVTYVANAVVSGSASGTLVNVANIAAPGGVGVVDPASAHPPGVCALDVSNNQCTDSDVIGQEADLTVTKLVTPTTTTPGGALTFTLTVSNAGPQAANGVSVFDGDLAGLGVELTNVSWTCVASANSACGSPQNGTGDIDHSGNVNLEAGGNVTYTIQATVSPSALGTDCTSPLPAGKCIRNTATATLPATHVDPTPDGLTATAQAALSAQADLSIVKTVTTPLDLIDTGDPLSYSIEVKNCGPSNAVDAQVQDFFSDDYENVSWTCAPAANCGAIVGAGDIVTSVTLAAGSPGTCAGAGTAIFTVTGTVAAAPSSNSLTNVAKILPPSGVVDPVTGNNTSSVLVALQAEAELAVVKSDGLTEAVPGTEITYTITVFNYGPDDAVNLGVNDLFPPELRDVQWTCNSEAPALGTLVFVEEQREGQSSEDGQVAGLVGTRAVAVAPDPDGIGPDPGGQFVYATGFGSNALAIFARDAATGRLEFEDSVVDGECVNGGDPPCLQIDGLANAFGLAISPDGDNLYVAGEADDKIAIFTRNLVLGDVSFVEVVSQGQVQTGGTVAGLDGPRHLAVSPDGEHVYVTSPTESSIAVFHRNTLASGRLEFVQSIDSASVVGLAGALGLRVSPDGKNVYVAAGTGGTVVVFARDVDDESATFGELTFVETHTDGVGGEVFLGGAADIELAPAGDFAYVAAATDDAVSVFSRDVTLGTLTYLSQVHEGVVLGFEGVGEVSGTDGAQAVLASPDGQHLYVSGRDSNAVAVFRRGTVTGELSFLEVRRDGVSGACVQPVTCLTNALEAPAGLALDSTGGHLYLSASNDDALSVFRREGVPPAFAFAGGRPNVTTPEPVRNGVDGVSGLDAVADIAIHGTHLFAVGFEDASIVHFERDPGTGTLEFFEKLSDGAGADGLAGAIALAVFDQSVYVVSQSVVQGENTLVTFQRDPGTDELSFEGIFRDGQGGVTGLFGAADVAVSADGLNVYVAARSPGSLAVFSRDQLTGALTFIESKIANQDGIVGLQGAHGLAISSDDRHIYVAASVDDVVAVFERDPLDEGRVEQIQVVTAAGVDRPIGIAVSHEATGSENVYVTGHTGDALAVFARDVDDTSVDFGKLTAIESHFDGSDDVDGLAGARAVTVSPDGKQVYVAGEDDDALAVFAREETTGRLVFIEARFDGVEGVEGLDQAYAVAVSGNSLQIYVAGFGEDAIALFTRTSGSRCTGAGAGTLSDTGVEVAAGGQVVYTVTATIDPAATGFLANEAHVVVPDSVTQPVPAAQHPSNVCDDNDAVGYTPIPDNDGCRDIDELKPQSDLHLEKSDGDNQAIPGEEVSYEIVVENDGASNVVGAVVEDILTGVFPAGASWTCVAAPSGSLSFAGAAVDGVGTYDGLAGAAAVAISLDGLHVYAASRGEDAVAAYELDGLTGELTFIEAERDGLGGVEGLDGATAVAVSPDGANVYVAGQIDDAVAVFTRNPLTGALTFLEVQQSPGTAGLDGPVAMALDAAGENLYVAAANSNAVTVFARNGGTGELTFLEMQQDGIGSVDGLAGASSVAVSADGASVYVTGENDSAVTLFSRAAGTGALTWQQTKFDGLNGSEGLEGARAVAISPDDANVYVAGTAESAIAVYTRDTGNGTLTFRQVVRDGVGGFEGLAGVNALVVSGDAGLGFHVYASGGASDAIAVLPRDAADFGRLAFHSVEGDGFGGVDGLAGVGGLAISANSRWVIAAGAVDNALAVFSRPTDSSCSGGSDFTTVDGIVLTDTVNIAAGSRIVYTVTGVVDPAICTIYPCVTNLVNSATVTMPVGNTDPDPDDNGDIDTDSLSPRADLSITKTDHIAVVSGLAGASAVAASPDGMNLYATGAIGDGVLVFARSGGGELVFLEAELDNVGEVDGLNGAAGVVVSADDRHVYVAGAADNAVTVFERAAADGRLEFLEKHQDGFLGVTGLLGPDGLGISSDGRYLYVAAASSSSIAIFERDNDELSASFGRLTFAGEVRDGVGGVDGLSLARAVALSPDSLNEHLYAVGESDNALAVFARDASTGLLTFLEMEQDGVAGVSGLAGPRGVALSPDGADVYVSGGTANAVAHFTRDVDSGSPEFGKATFVAAYVDGAGGVDGLQGAGGIVVAPDPDGPDPGGQHVYVAGRAEDAVAVFARDAGTGALTFVAAAREGQAGFDGLSEPTGLALSPDGANLYAAGAGVGSVVTSARDWDGGTLSGTGALAFVESDREGDGTAAPGQLVTYEIVVSNAGPSAVNGAIVTDIFPGELEDLNWTCTSLTPGAACLGGDSGNGDLVRPVRLPPGGSAMYTVTGTIKPGVTGTIVNTATISEPNGFIELDPSDNSATDQDTILARRANLAIAKIACTDPLDCAATEVTTLVPGTQVHYEIRVDNGGPSDVEGAAVDDILSELLSSAAWSCVATPVPGLLAPITSIPPMPALHDGDDVDDLNLCGPVTLTHLNGLDGARAVEISADGLNVYVAGGVDHAVASFRRDLRDGTLAWVGLVVDGQTNYGPGCAPDGLVDGLRGASGIAASGDGSHVYVAAELDDAVSVYSRHAGTGALDFLEFKRDGVGGVNGLGNVRGLALSPDGKHLYTAARSDNGIGIFSRNAGSGLLTYFGILVDGAPQAPLTIDGLAGAVAVALSPDGTHVYVAGETDDAVAVFSRDAATGALTFVEAKKNGLGGVTGLDGARALALSGDGLHLYVASALSDAVAVFSRDAATGALTFVEEQVNGVGGASGLDGASGVRISADGENVYVTGENDGAVAVFARNPLTGVLAPQPGVVDGADGVDGLSGARGLAISPNDEHLYAVGEAEDGLSLLERGTGSRCTPAGFGDIHDVVDITAGGFLVYSLAAELSPAATGTLENRATATPPDDVHEIDGADNESVNVADLAPEVNLTVTKTDFQTEAVPGLPLTYTITVSNAGPSDLVGASVEDLFPAAFEDAAWSCVASDALAFVESETNGASGVAGLDSPYGVAVAPDPDGLFGPIAGGAYVYTAARASEAIDLWSRDAGTGEVTFVTSYVDGTGGLDGFGGAGGLAISPDGAHLYATGKSDDAVAIFSLDGGTGDLTLAAVVRDSDPGIDGLDGASVVTVSRDGRNVYVGSEDDNSLVVFARDAGTGLLTFLERWKNGFGGLELGDLDRPAAVVATIDGKQVIVAAADGDRLTLFDRDPSDGRLARAQVVQDGVDGVDGLDLVSSIAISSGGQFLYAAGLADDAIAIFERDTATGEISYIAQAKDGVDGIEGLDGVRSLAATPDGLFLFAASYNEDAVSIFRRDAVTGLLTSLQVATDGVSGVSGLDGARQLATDPSGRDVYVVAEHGDSVAVLSRAGQGYCAAGADGDLASPLDLAVGASATFTALGSVHPAAVGLLDNTVTVTMPGGTTNTGDTSATDSDALTPVADLGITKSDGVTSVSPGSATIYLITVTNTGPSDAPASLVSDLPPAAILTSDWTCTGSGGGVCAAAGTGPIAESVELPVGGSVIFALTAVIDGGATGQLVNTATVAPAAAVADPVPANNSASDTDTLAAEADLILFNESDQPVAEIGEPVTFLLTVDNDGPAMSAGITLIDLLPSGAVLTGVTAPGWSCISGPGSVTCTLASLDAGNTAPPVMVHTTAPTTPGNYLNAATVSSTSLDPVLPNNSASAPFAVVVLEPPSVANVDTVPDTGDATLDLMETATVAITEIVVTFNEALFDPAGDADPSDVTNPANYQLVEASTNGNFTTPNCASLVGDDVGIAVDAVAFDAGAATATLSINGGAGISDGLYRLVLCTAPGLRDLDGNSLDGNGDFVPGDDFVTFFRVQLENLLLRPYADFAEDLTSWNGIGGLPEDYGFGTVDAGGFPLSGSFRMQNGSGDSALGLAQCVTVPFGINSFVMSGKVRINGAGSTTEAGGLVEAIFGPCLAPVSVLASWDTGSVTGDTGGLFKPFSGTLSLLPPATTHLRVTAVAVDIPGQSINVRFDNLSLVPALFADGFETGDTSRWSSAVP